MKRRRDLQLLAAQIPLGEEFRRPVDLGKPTGQHDLIGTVVVGDHQIDGHFADRRFDLRERSADRQHPAVDLLRLGHQPAAQHRQPVERLRGEPARRAERGQLTVTMTGGGFGIHAELFENRERSETHRTNRRLRDLSRPQFAVLPGASFIGPRRDRIDEVTQAVNG